MKTWLPEDVATNLLLHVLVCRPASEASQEFVEEQGRWGKHTWQGYGLFTLSCYSFLHGQRCEKGANRVTGLKSNPQKTASLTGVPDMRTLVFKTSWHMQALNGLIALLGPATRCKSFTQGTR
jgi:hypothetical protein